MSSDNLFKANACHSCDHLSFSGHSFLFILATYMFGYTLNSLSSKSNFKQVLSEILAFNISAFAITPLPLSFSPFHVNLQALISHSFPSTSAPIIFTFFTTQFGLLEFPYRLCSHLHPCCFDHISCLSNHQPRKKQTTSSLLPSC